MIILILLWFAFLMVAITLLGGLALSVTKNFDLPSFLLLVSLIITEVVLFHVLFFGGFNL